MPFKNKAQMRALFAKDPELAKKWVDRYGVPTAEGPKRKSRKRAKRKLTKALRRGHK